jgi:hypothetical protein
VAPAEQQQQQQLQWTQQVPVQQQQTQWSPTPTTVFFAGVTPVADSQRLRALFSQFGHVMDLNLFRPYNGCRTSKVCGWRVGLQSRQRLEYFHGSSLLLKPANAYDWHC